MSGTVSGLKSTAFSNSKVADAIRYANNRGKLILAAAGTSTTFANWVGVIFPATMSVTVAVTGVKEEVAIGDVIPVTLVLKLSSPS